MVDLNGVPDSGSATSAEVAELIASLGKTARSRSLYDVTNPMYQRFLATLRQGLEAFWEHSPSLTLLVEETGFRWNEELFSTGEGREALHFLFYKDGVQFLTIQRGFEDEVDRFLEVVFRARLPNQTSDNLITLLWQADFTSLLYGFVDVGFEGVELPEVSDEPPQLVPPQAVRQDVTEAQAEPAGITREDFEETLYFLDEDELLALQEEVDREWSRDVKTDVLNALFDRLEEPFPVRQSEVLEVLHQLLPMFLSGGDLASAARVLRELDALVQREGGLGEEQRAEIEKLYGELNDPAVLAQLIESLITGGFQSNIDDLSLFFVHVGPAALPLLIRAADAAPTAEIKERVWGAVFRLGTAHADELLYLLDSTDSSVAMGAARVAGELKLVQAVAGLARLLGRPEAALRRAGVDALVAVMSREAMQAVERALDDADRQVRIAAARGLGTAGHRPARARFEERLQSKELREADLTEKIAFFESYGLLAGDESVAVLDDLLNGKDFLRRKKPPEMRACAALALGRVGTASARAALDRASDESDPVVRSAVLRALRHEVAAS